MKNLFETEDFKEIREIIRNTIIEASKSIPEDMYTIIKEATYYISKQIEDMIVDEIKFNKIVEDWFENGIKKLIKSTPSQFIANLDKLKKEYPEAEKLESLEIYLDPNQESFHECGSTSDFRKIDKFKTTLFLNAILYIQTGVELEKFKYNVIKDLPEKFFNKLYLDIKRTMIHELSHILDSFQVSMTELIKDFESKAYFDNESELKAHETAFLYHFWKENGISLIDEYDFDTFKKKVERMDCWNEIGPAKVTPMSNERYGLFLKRIYDYFKNKNNLMLEVGEGINTKQHYTRPSDIIGEPSASELAWARKVGSEMCPQAYGLEPETKFLDMDDEDKAAALFLCHYYPDKIREAIYDDIEQLKSEGKLDPYLHLMKRIKKGHH